MRLRSRIVRPKTGILKLASEVKSFTAAMIAMFQVQACMSKFGATEVLLKSGLSKIVPFEGISKEMTCYESKAEELLLLWSSIVLIYLPALHEALSSDGNSKSRTSEDEECFAMVSRGCDEAWSEYRDYQLGGSHMASQTKSMCSMVMLCSLVMYDGLRGKLRNCFVSPDSCTALLEKSLKKVMESIFNGFQMKAPEISSQCIHLLDQISHDLYSAWKTACSSCTIEFSRYWSFILSSFLGSFDLMFFICLQVWSRRRLLGLPFLADEEYSVSAVEIEHNQRRSRQIPLQHCEPFVGVQHDLERVHDRRVHRGKPCFECCLPRGCLCQRSSQQ